MVAGDLVNTASRIQSAAEPGHGARRRGDEARDRGGDRLRGRRRARAEGQGGAGAALARAARDRRVAAARCGRPAWSRRSSAATASSASSRSCSTRSADEGKAHLVSVTGIAGIGKSRLSWEFEKYIDGLADDVCWHRGRCLSYGEGVAYWALAEMVRMRCDIAEDEEPRLGAGEAARDARGARRRPGGARLGRAAARPPARPRGGRARRPGEPLLRLADPLRATRRERADDPRLRGHAVGRQRPARLPRVPARVVAQPPALRPRPGPTRAGGQAPDLGRRQAQLHVALPRAAVRARRWRSCSPGSCRASRRTCAPDPRARRGRAALRGRDRAHAARPRPARAGGQRLPADRADRDARGAGDAARADRRAPRRSRARGAAARPGRRGARQDVHEAGLARAHRACRADELEPLLGALVRKEVLVDPGRPALARARPVRVPAGHRAQHVAYETLSKRERKAKHLGAAEFLESRSGARTRTRSSRSIAAHYVDAYERRARRRRRRRDPNPSAREMLVRAGERAASLGASSEAQHAYERAIELRTTRSSRRTCTSEPG